MWDCRWRWWGPDNHKTHHHRLLILQNDVDEDNLDFDHDRDPTATIASAAMVLTTWLCRRRRRRYLLLLALFSPLLLPFLCAAFPLLCAVEICLRLSRRRRRRRIAGDRMRRCEEGRGEMEEGGGEMRVLLQRYLEDQLVLVVGSVYECGDDDDDCSDDDLLERCEFLDSSDPI